MRVAVIATAIGLSIVGLASAGEATAAIRKPTDIPAQSLGSALQALAKERDFQIVCRADLVKDLRTPGISGDFTPDEALTHLLHSTGLTHRFIDEKTVTIVPVSANTLSLDQERVSATQTGEDAKKPETTSGEEKAGRSFWDRFRVAQVDQGKAQSSVDKDSTAAPAVQEVVVTAQKRRENLQDVPVSAQVVTGQDIVAHNWVNLQSLTQSLPAVNVSQHPRGGDLFIRGIGSGENETFDQSVGIFIDDIYHGRARTTAATFLDLGRVEVLKGPQSTFFGNNAIAGALNIITNKPGAESEGYARALYGQDGQFGVEGAANVPINNWLSVRAAAIYSGSNGWLHNIYLNRDEPQTRNLAERITVGLRPINDLEINLKAEVSRNAGYGTGSEYNQIIDCPPPAPFVASGFCAARLAQGLPTGLNDKRNARYIDGTDLFTHDYVVTADYRLGEQTLSSITGWYDYDFKLEDAGDATPQPLLNALVDPEHYEQFSQELRLTSPVGQPLEYLLGAYYQHDRQLHNQTINYIFLTPLLQSIPALAPYLPLGQQDRFHQIENARAVFGALTWNVTRVLKVTAGVRGTWVQKDFDSDVYFGQLSGGPYCCLTPDPGPLQPQISGLGLGATGVEVARRKDHALLPSAKVQYDAATDAMLYASYSRGFKAGGFNGADTSGDPKSLPFSPEHVHAYEVGLKSKWFANRVLANVAVFRSNYSDLQSAVSTVTAAGAPISVVRNAGSSRSQGIELEAEFAVSRVVRLTANGSYLDSKYLRYPNVAPTQAQALAGLVTQDESGRPTPFAPRWSGNIALDAREDIGSALQLSGNVNAFLSSSHFIDGHLDPLVAQPGFYRIDARVSLESTNSRWGVDLIGKNLNDRKIFTYAQAFALSPGSVGVSTQEPRNVAVQLRYEW